MQAGSNRGYEPKGIGPEINGLHRNPLSSRNIDMTSKGNRFSSVLNALDLVCSAISDTGVLETGGKKRMASISLYIFGHEAFKNFEKHIGSAGDQKIRYNNLEIMLEILPQKLISMALDECVILGLPEDNAYFLLLGDNSLQLFECSGLFTNLGDSTPYNVVSRDHVEVGGLIFREDINYQYQSDQRTLISGAAPRGYRDIVPPFSGLKEDTALHEAISGCHEGIKVLHNDNNGRRTACGGAADSFKIHIQPLKGYSYPTGGNVIVAKADLNDNTPLLRLTRPSLFYNRRVYVVWGEEMGIPKLMDNSVKDILGCCDAISKYLSRNGAEPPEPAAQSKAAPNNTLYSTPLSTDFLPGFCGAEKYGSGREGIDSEIGGCSDSDSDSGGSYYDWGMSSISSCPENSQGHRKGVGKRDRGCFLGKRPVQEISKYQSGGRNGGTDPRPKRLKSNRGGETKAPRKQFACPYFKKNPLIYSDCAGWRNTSLGLLREHIRGAHLKPIQCGRCGIFRAGGHEGITQHLMDGDCAKSEIFESGVDIAKEKAESVDRARTWQEIYETLFPLHIPDPFWQDQIEVLMSPIENNELLFILRVRDAISFNKHAYQLGLAEFLDERLGLGEAAAYELLMGYDNNWTSNISSQPSLLNDAGDYGHTVTVKYLPTQRHGAHRGGFLRVGAAAAGTA